MLDGKSATATRPAERPSTLAVVCGGQRDVGMDVAMNFDDNVPVED